MELFVSFMFILGLIVIVLVLIVALYVQRARSRKEVAILERRLKEDVESARIAVLEEAAKLLKDKEKEMRADAIQRSQATIRGKIAEQLAPYIPDFEYDPRDCRFLGSPVDFVIFDGLSSCGECAQIVFVEVKSGKSRISRREKSVADAIEAGAVDYEIIRLEQTL